MLNLYECHQLEFILNIYASLFENIEIHNYVPTTP